MLKSFKMNRFLRACIVNSKNILNFVTIKSTTVSVTAFRSLNFSIKPVLTPATTLFNINRTFRDARRPSRILNDDLLDEEDTNELSVSPKSHNQSDAKNYSENESNFEKFDLPKELLRRLKELGYDTPFPIQSATLPYTLIGK